MRKINGRKAVEVNTSSMADIAFLLLIFFLVTTTMNQDKGLMMRLPANVEVPPAPKHERDLFNILINSSDELMVENEMPYDPSNLRTDIKQFILNWGEDDNLSVSPNDAVVSIKSNRGTSYKVYIKVLDEVQAAYFEIYGKRVGLTADEFRKLDHRDPDQLAMYQKAREGIPMNISIAKPNN